MPKFPKSLPITGADLVTVSSLTKPSTVIATDKQPHEGATSLAIYYVGNRTYVISHGEFSNHEPWMFRGHIEPSVVLGEYIASLDEDPKDQPGKWKP